MVLREEGVSDFPYEEGKDLFRFPHGRFAFSGEWADVDPLQERGYFGQVYLDSSVLSLTSTEHRCKERRPVHGSKATKATIQQDIELVLGILVISVFVALLVVLID